MQFSYWAEYSTCKNLIFLNDKGNLQSKSTQPPPPTPKCAYTMRKK